MNSKDVVKKWATHVQGENAVGRNSHDTISFRGYDLYSYKTKVGVRYPAHHIALLTTKTYSTTTAHHLSMAWSACCSASPPLPVVHVPYPEILPWEVGRADHGNAHTLNLGSLRASYDGALKSLDKTRASRDIKIWEYNTPGRALERLTTYAKAFGMESAVELPDAVQDLARALEAHRIRREFYLSPKEVEKRIRREARALLKELVEEDG